MTFLEKINDIGVVEYLCNTEEDLQNITIQDIKPGSTAHIITPKKDYILDEDKTWVEYIKEKEPKKEKETILCLDKYHITKMWFDNLKDTEYAYFEDSIYIVPKNLKELKIAIWSWALENINELRVWNNVDHNTICTIQKDEFEEYTNEWGSTYHIYTFTEEVLEQILQYKIVEFEFWGPPM